jgi:hypothetical protein
MKFGKVRIMDIPTSFIWIILFDVAFKCGVGIKFLFYVATNAEPLCVEFDTLLQ